MTLAAPQVMSPEEWLSTYVPLGVSENDAWTPHGAGVLFVDAPVVWLITARSVLEAAGERQLLAWIADEAGGTMVDLTVGTRGELEWIRHPELDVAVCLFPLAPNWKIKAFNEARCFQSDALSPLLSAMVLSCAYGLGPLRARPQPLVMHGALSGAESTQLVATAPLLPRNAGAPLLVPLPAQMGGGVALAGIALQTLAVPESHDSVAPPVRLTVALPIAHALGLIRSEPGKALRKLAVEASK